MRRTLLGPYMHVFMGTTQLFREHIARGEWREPTWEEPVLIAQQIHLHEYREELERGKWGVADGE